MKSSRTRFSGNAIAFLCGALALGLLSIPQKMLLGLDAFVLEGFIVPILFGGGAGVLVRFLFHKSFAGKIERENEAVLHKKIAVFDRVEALSRHGHWDWNLTTDEAFFSSEMYQVMGIEEGAREPNLETLLTMVHPKDIERAREAVKFSARQRAAFNEELTILHPALGERLVWGQGKVFQDGGDGSDHFIGVLNDVTEIRGTKRALDDKVRELDFQKLALDQHAIVSAADADGNISYVNEKFCEISGYAPSELIGNNHRIVKSEEHPPELYEDLWQTITNGKVWHGELKNRKKDGGFYWVEVTIVPFLDENRKPFRYISIRTDVTELKQAQEKLSQNEERFRKIFEIIPDAFMVTRLRDGYCTNVNDGFTEITGYPREEIVGRKTSDLNLWVDESQRDDLATQLRENGSVTNFEGFFRNKDGSTYQGLMSAQVVKLDEDVYIISSTKDVTELREAKEAAEKANQAKSEFLSTMSHELRTPMNAILGFGQMLNNNPKEPLSKGQQTCVAHILNGGNHLLELINDVLDLARIDSGRVNLEMGALTLSEVVKDVETLVQGMAEDKGVEILWPDENSDHCLFADFTRTKQVLLNLVSNAVKYNHEGGKVTVLAEPTRGKTLKVSVTDTGYGISRDRQKEIFQPFHRLGAETTEVEGTGIGLFVSKRLIDLMGGDIGFWSEPDRGSSFWFELPLASDWSESMFKGERTDGFENKFSSLSGTVLYVEDSPANVELMEVIVSYVEGLSLITAKTGEEGLTLAQRQKPDVIILDINLPGMNGFEVLEHLKSNSDTAKIPVFALSAAATKSDIDKGRKAGFVQYLTKPVKVDLVVEALKQGLELN